MSKLAFVFPGQGSQSVGMLAEIGEHESLVVDTFKEASEVLGYDLWELVQQDEQGRLDKTEFTQPALLCASIALYRVWQNKGGRRPDVVAGHSLGEYSALVAAEALAFSDAITLVQLRGQYMQSAVPVGEGSMAAILGLDDDKVVEICAQCSDEHVVQAANFNSPGQVVIAGHVAALEKAIVACKEAGARKAMQLTVSAPFHSKLMEPAAARMSADLQAVQIKAPQIEIIQNVDAKPHRDPESIRENLVSQMFNAVKWTETVQWLSADGCTLAVECGPGKVLCGLIKRIDKDITTCIISDPDSMQSALNTI
jgi:[acyl-carrier-protein] S-malonyltransferase